MTYEQTLSAERASIPLPKVRHITLSDLGDALARGIDDFKAKPSHVILLGILYPVVGLILGRLAFGYDLLPLLFPLIAGFSLLGPVAAIGFYELSRRREAGLSATWWDAFAVFGGRSSRAILTLAFVLMAIFLLWVEAAQLIAVATIGDFKQNSISAFVAQVFGTEEGRQLILIGNAVGFVFAAVIFTISVVSFPLLIDKETTAPAAVVTSIKAVLKNPLPMAAWAMIIAATLLVASLPFFLGLAVAVPVLGHASWHLYRKAIER